MIVVVEGPDNSGKSTLVEAIRAIDPRARVVLGGPASRDALLARMTAAFVMHEAGEVVVCDRFPAVSEPVYGPILRERSELDDVDARASLGCLKAVGAVVVYCRPPDDAVLDMRTHRRGPSDTPEHLSRLNERKREILERYDEIFADLEWIGLDVRRYDRTCADSTSFAEEILRPSSA